MLKHWSVSYPEIEPDFRILDGIQIYGNCKTTESRNYYFWNLQSTILIDYRQTDDRQITEKHRAGMVAVSEVCSKDS
jgi:hypothetical protein